jgi:hypothetical protein
VISDAITPEAQVQAFPLQRMQIDEGPADFSTVVRELRDRLWPILVQARKIAPP